MKVLGAALLACVIMLTSCGGGSGNASRAGLSGNWQMTLQNQTSTETQSGFLLQSGNTVAGSVQLSGQTISGQTNCTGVGSALGQTKGSAVTMTVSPVGQTVNLTGTAANNFTSMSGSYAILASGCGQTEVGTWTAAQVNSLTGSFQATFTSSDTGNVFGFSGTITQGPNTGGSTATLSGSMMSTNAPCFTSATIAGLISGTSVVLNLLSTEGVALGKYQGTTTTDATSMTGYYRFSNAVTGGCQDIGGATFTVQSPPAK